MRWTVRALWAAAFLGAFGGLALSPVGQTSDLRSLDLFRRPRAPHPDIVILAIDSKSVEELGRWPWSRATHARILDALRGFEPRALGVDVLFASAESDAADAALERSLQASSFPVVLAAEAVYVRGSPEPRRLVEPLPRFAEVLSASVGHVNVPADPDGVARRLPAPLTVGDATVFPLSFRLAEILHAELPPAEGRLVHFAGPAGQFPTYSVSDVVAGRVPRERLAGKILLLGATASSLRDTVLVPLGTPVLAGVEWHANALDNLLLRRSLVLVPTRVTLAIQAALVLLFFGALGRLPARALSFLLAAAVVLSPLASLLLWRKGIAWPWLLAAALVLGLFVFHGLYRWVRAEAEKRQLKRTFRHYFSPAVLRAILRDPASLKLGGQRREVTVLFSDIRSFTTITEALPPEKLTSLLHEYFTEMTEEILGTDGVLDKFIGDAIMAFWGAPVPQPDQADRAVRAALGMLRRLRALQPQWQAAGYPLIDCGIGITTGLATVGNMGSAKRFDYTVIGDTVNAASRLEGLNKEYKTHLIVSEATKNALTLPVTTRSLGAVTVKGKTEPLTIYEVVS